MTDRWIRRWSVPSSSNPDKSYTVAKDREGRYGCDCPAWKFQRKRLSNGECHHIRRVKQGGGNPTKVPKEPEIALANVLEVMPVKTSDGIVQLRVPLIPLGDTHFQATLLYDCLRFGISWSTLRQRYDLAKRNSRKAVIDYVRERGRSIYEKHDPFCSGRTLLPAPMNDGL